jgi:hypothetical protein
VRSAGGAGAPRRRDSKAMSRCFRRRPDSSLALASTPKSVDEELGWPARWLVLPPIDADRWGARPGTQ